MSPIEAAEIVDVVAESLKGKPGQFHISVKTVGQSFVTNGGIGMSISVSSEKGGGPVIGNQVTVAGGNTVQIAQHIKRWVSKWWHSFSCFRACRSN